jgi:hypothetical protein
MTYSRGFDVILFHEVDDAELLRTRMIQKMSLARYGRVSPFEWERRDINELRRHYACLSELLKNESALRGAQEDG